MLFNSNMHMHIFSILSKPVNEFIFPLIKVFEAINVINVDFALCNNEISSLILLKDIFLFFYKKKYKILERIN